MLANTATLVLLLQGTGPAQTTVGPLDVVRDVYAWEKKLWGAREDDEREVARTRAEAHLSASLRALMRADEACGITTGGICNLDWDPLVGAQDLDPEWLDSLKLKLLAQLPETAKVRASYTSADGKWMQTLDLDLAREEGTWVIANVRTKEWSLVKVLARPLPDVELRAAASRFKGVVGQRPNELPALVSAEGVTCGQKKLSADEARARLAKEAPGFSRFFEDDLGAVLNLDFALGTGGATVWWVSRKNGGLRRTPLLKFETDKAERWWLVGIGDECVR